MDKSTPYLQPRLAWALLDLGEVEQAAAQVEQALMLARSQHQRLYLVDALRIQARVRMRQQRWDEAVAALEEGLSLARSMGYLYAEAQLLHVYAQMGAQRGELDGTRQQIKEALSIFRQLGARKDIERADELRAKLAE